MGFGGRPTIETLGVILAVFAVQQLVGLVGWWEYLFVLAAPLTDRPWTLVTSVYAHLTVGHLLANAVALAIAGPFVARRTTRVAFHGFFVTTGALAGASEVLLGGLMGPSTAVVGASGAIFALVGYLLSGNVVSTVLLDRISLSKRTQFLLFLAVAVVITIATAGTRVALFGHATGLLLGLLAGRGRLLDATDGSDRSRRSGRESGPF